MSVTSCSTSVASHHVQVDTEIHVDRMLCSCSVGSSVLKQKSMSMCNPCKSCGHPWNGLMGSFDLKAFGL